TPALSPLCGGEGELRAPLAPFVDASRRSTAAVGASSQTAWGAAAARPDCRHRAVERYTMSPALVLHVGAGCLAILAGAAALGVRKGERLHRASGKAFVVAMLVMGTFATYLSIVRQPGTIAGGILAGYMVATAWMTARRKEGSVGPFETFAMFVALGCV